MRTLISYEDFMELKSKEQLEYYLSNSNNCYVYNDIKSAESAIKKIPLWNYVMIEINDYDGLFIFRITKNYMYKHIYLRLRSCEVNVFRVKIPELSEIRDENRIDHKCNTTIPAYMNLVKTGDIEAPWYINKVTDIETNTYVGTNLFEKQMGNADKTIFLVGPCIVGGLTNPIKESLGEILYTMLGDRGCHYNLEFIQSADWVGERAYKETILERTIKSGDIVIMLSNELIDYEFDTVDVYNSYNGDKWLYQDEPIHTTVTGNKLLAEFLVEKVILPFSRYIESSQNVILYKGEPQFTIELQKNIYNYIKQIKQEKLFNEIYAKGEIGSVVMNCNPFTYGHRFLVEYAAGIVDYLYLFVVEENLSAIPFFDRLFMVYEGVRDIADVVVPSGQFIISQDTFKNYFEKETNIQKVNAGEDVHIFAQYIARELHITKRFVGEEPNDYVTRVYNETMKQIFPEYGIELVEIPRKELETGNIISASVVRKLLLEEKWNEIVKYIPETSLKHLKKIKENVKERICRNKSENCIQKQIQAFINMVSHMQKVVIYSVGRDSEGLIKRLPNELVSKIEFCDRAAFTEEIYFHNKKVYAPDQLLSKFLDYNIIITSTLYGAEIYEDFVRMGINLKRCVFNSISFSTNEE